MTSLLTESATATETILKRNKPAPFDGVLVAEKQYRTYVANEFELRDLRQSNSMISTQMDGLLQRETERKNDEPSRFTWFISGLALGLAASLASK